MVTRTQGEFCMDHHFLSLFPPIVEPSQTLRTSETVAITIQVSLSSPQQKVNLGKEVEQKEDTSKVGQGSAN